MPKLQSNTAILQRYFSYSTGMLNYITNRPPLCYSYTWLYDNYITIIVHMLIQNTGRLCISWCWTRWVQVFTQVGFVPVSGTRWAAACPSWTTAHWRSTTCRGKTLVNTAASPGTASAWPSPNQSPYWSRVSRPVLTSLHTGPGWVGLSKPVSILVQGD